jgi:hypothetical protein
LLGQIGQCLDKEERAYHWQKKVVEPDRLIDRERLQEGLVEERYGTHGVSKKAQRLMKPPAGARSAEETRMRGLRAIRLTKRLSMKLDSI